MSDKYKAFGNARGNKLWEGSRMILPEHRAYMLRKELHEERFIERPVLDEEKLMEMSRTVSEAIDRGTQITLKVYDPYGLQDIEMVPIRLEIDRLKGRDGSGGIKSVVLSEIVDIEMLFLNASNL